MKTLSAQQWEIAAARARMFGLAKADPVYFKTDPVGLTRWDAVSTPWGWCARRWVDTTWVEALWGEEDPKLEEAYEPEGWGFGWQGATPFQDAVWRWAMGVSRPVSYGEGAAFVGVPGGARAVGGALSRNPLAPLVACHWPGRSDGALGGFSWGIERKVAWRALEQGARG